MSSIICFAELDVWGSNGQIELYVEALLAQSRQRFGDCDPFTTFFHDLRDQFPFMGRGVYLDALLTDRERCRRFVEIAMAASAQLGEDFSNGLMTHWLEVEIAELITRVAQAADGGPSTVANAAQAAEDGRGEASQ